MSAVSYRQVLCITYEHLGINPQKKGTKQMNTIDVATLVDLVVARARTDTTAPDPNNVRVGWRTDQLLTGDVDTLVCYNCNDPAMYAEIGRQVLAEVQALPEIAALVRLAIFRGERLLPVNEERKRALLEMVQKLGDFIGTLPDGTRKKRCSSLFQYHTGVFYDAYGCFAEAAEAQRQAADIAELAGDMPGGAAISSFVAAVYELKDALCSGTADRINASFTALQHQHLRLIEAVRGTAFEVSWGQGNAPMHMVEACVWLDRQHPDQNAWVETAIAAAEKLGQAFKGCADLVQAVRLDWANDAGAEDALKRVAESNNVNEQKAAALLILVRRAQKEGDAEEARQFASQMPETGAQHVRAIAARLLVQ